MFTFQHLTCSIYRQTQTQERAQTVRRFMTFLFLFFAKNILF